MAAQNYFDGYPRSVGDPGDNIALITPHDTNLLDPVPSSIYFGASGDVAIEGKNGHSEIVPAIAGVTFPLRARRILATGTAAGMLAKCFAIYN